MHFTKMHGAGNDYIYINIFNEKVQSPEKLTPQITDRHFGVGGDGLILIGPGKDTEFRMDMYNIDGTWSEMCGNALRCVAKYLWDHKMAKNPVFDIETGAGIKKVEIIDENRNDNSDETLVKINMGNPYLQADEIPIKDMSGMVVKESIVALDRTFTFTAVSMGNPHCIIFLDEDIDKFPLEKYGPVIENHSLFPKRTNVEIVNIRDNHTAYQRTWERGCGETLACGTGASAVLVAGILEKRLIREADIILRGGKLHIEWSEADNNVYMTGPAVKVFEGEY